MCGGQGHVPQTMQHEGRGICHKGRGNIPLQRGSAGQFMIPIWGGNCPLGRAPLPSSQTGDRCPLGRRPHPRSRAGILAFDISEIKPGSSKQHCFNDRCMTWFCNPGYAMVLKISPVERAVFNPQGTKHCSDARQIHESGKSVLLGKPPPRHYHNATAETNRKERVL